LTSVFVVFYGEDGKPSINDHYLIVMGYEDLTILDAIYGFPNILSRLRNLTDFSTSVATAGTLIFVGSTSGLDIVDFRDPENPLDLTTYPIGSLAGVAVFGTRVLTVDMSGVLNTSMPAIRQAHELGSCSVQLQMVEDVEGAFGAQFNLATQITETRNSVQDWEAYR